jgi:hypothetical protein
MIVEYGLEVNDNEEVTIVGFWETVLRRCLGMCRRVGRESY